MGHKEDLHGQVIPEGISQRETKGENGEIARIIEPGDGNDHDK